MSLLFILFIVFFIIKVTKSVNSTSIAVINKLNVALQRNQFTNRKTLMTNQFYTLITADTHGENYVFAVKNNTTQFNFQDIVSIYEMAQKAHIHNIVVLNHFNMAFYPGVAKKMKEYGIEVWDSNKLNELTGTKSATVTRSVLKTSDTSDDKCNISVSSDDPIQDFGEKKPSIFDRLFQKPDRL